MPTDSKNRCCKDRSRRTAVLADGFPPTEGMYLMNEYSVFKVQKLVETGVSMYYSTSKRIIWPMLVA